MNRDSYLNFLEKFNISNEDFIEYGLNDIIFVPNDKVISEWEILKNKVYSNQEVYIRGMGRDAVGTKYMFEVHKNLFGNSNIKKTLQIMLIQQKFRKLNRVFKKKIKKF